MWKQVKKWLETAEHAHFLYGVWMWLAAHGVLAVGVTAVVGLVGGVVAVGQNADAGEVVLSAVLCAASGLVVCLLVVAFFIGPDSWRRRHELIPIHDAVGLMIEGTRQSALWNFHEGFGSQRHEVWFAYVNAALKAGVVVYGKTPPAKDWVPVSFEPTTRDITLGLARVVAGKNGGPPRYEELSIERSGIRTAIRAINAEPAD